MKIEIEIDGRDFKKAIRTENCLKYVAKHIDDLEPIIRQHWFEQEIKTLANKKKGGNENER